MDKKILVLLQLLLKKLKIPVDRDELEFQIQSHPSYPSLHAITGVLDHFNIENAAIDVPTTREILIQLTDCFIAQITTKNGQSLVVVERKGLNYLLFNTENKKEEISESEFLKRFTGIIVVVEKSETTKQIKHTSKLWETISLLALTALVFFTLYNTSTSIYNILFLLLSITGLIISIAIIKQELGLTTSIGNAFCSGIDDKKDCDAVLTSTGAKIFKDYKLSDFSILYFTGLTVLTFIQVSNLIISFSISLLAIPITLYSLYYQYAVIKKWCLLCLSIVGVLWLQAIISFLTNGFIKDFITNDFVVFGLLAFSTLIAWSYIKPLFIEVHQLRKEKVENTRFKRNFSLFNNLLQNAPTLNTQLTESEEIIFGNPKANLEILLVTNPFCGFCKPVHNHIEEIINRYQDKVKIKIRFNSNPNDKDGNVIKITSKLIEIYNDEGDEICLKAMGDIYGKMSSDKWLKKWGECSEKKKFLLELEKEYSWCMDNAINFTPEILINGKSFPKEYNNKTDLIFFIEDLEENSCLENTLVETTELER